MLHPPMPTQARGVIKKGAHLSPVMKNKKLVIKKGFRKGSLKLC